MLQEYRKSAAIHGDASRTSLHRGTPLASTGTRPATAGAAEPTTFPTYSIASPSDVTIRAACEQVGCEAWRNGWESVINEATDLGKAQANYIRTRAGRTFREQRTAGGFTVFRFESGQRCFAEHQTRPELYAVRDGDWRGNPTGRVRRHVRAADWVEDFGEHQQAVKDQVEKG